MNIEGNFSAPFLRPAWLEALEAAFGNPLITVEDHGASAVFEIEEKTLFFAGRSHWLSDYAVLKGNQVELLRLVEVALRGLPSTVSVNRIILDAIDSELGGSIAGEIPGWHQVRRFQAWAPELWLTDRASLESITKKDSFKRAKKKLEKGGHRVEIEIFTDLESRKRVLDEFIAQHSKRSMEKRGATEFKDPRYKKFLEELLARDLVYTHDPCRVHFSALKLDGVRVAFHLGFVTPERFFWYKPTFSTSKTAIAAPGEYLMVRLIEEAFKNGVKVFDFTIGDEGYKSRFSNRNKALYEFRFYRSKIKACGWRLRQWIKGWWNRVGARK